MAKGDLFKRSLEVGASFLDMSRDRAEALVKEWVEAGDLGKGKAKKAVDEVLDRSRRVTEELQAIVQREIASQLAHLGVATSDDVARLEAKLDALAAAGAAAPMPGPAPTTPSGPTGRRATSGSPVGKAASTAPRPAKTAATTDPGAVPKPRAPRKAVAPPTGADAGDAGPAT